MQCLLEVRQQSNSLIPLAVQSSGSDVLVGCIRQCDWDENDVCRSCGTDYSPPKKLRPFHLAFPVDDLNKAKEFYVNVLGCSTGREKKESCVFNFFGHQIVAHHVAQMPDVSTNPVDGKQIPVMHFGIVLEWNDWHQLKDKLDKNGVEFVVGPYTRYENQPGSQATMFIVDPCGNHLEFKSFKDDGAIFDSAW
ncbi:MAG: VOC family protein [Candidatus Thermoplasmatota archaeon]|nr:VOC family protein [Candidatus Thermoplasmatota archaeon]